MKKQSDRIKDWRDRQKAEGKASITIMLSQDARSFLLAEKEKTRESYATIIENALLMMKKQNYRRPALKYYPSREDAPARIPAVDHQPPVIPQLSQENEEQPKILIDDFANYPSIKDIEHEQAEKKKNGLSELKFKKGFFNRLFRS